MLAVGGQGVRTGTGDTSSAGCRGTGWGREGWCWLWGDRAWGQGLGTQGVLAAGGQGVRQDLGTGELLSGGDRDWGHEWHWLRGNQGLGMRGMMLALRGQELGTGRGDTSNAACRGTGTGDRRDTGGVEWGLGMSAMLAAGGQDLGTQEMLAGGDRDWGQEWHWLQGDRDWG